MKTRATLSLGLIPVIVLLAVAPGSASDDAGQAAGAAAVSDTVPAGDIALGRKVYEGKAGGAMCATCHGPQAKGVPGIGPDLTDDTWLHGDGSAAFLRSVIGTGVMKPKKSAAVMPPKGGGNLSAEQLNAVAAYVGSLRK